MLVPGLGKGGAGGFAEELHGARAEPLQRFKGYRVERVSGARVVCVAVRALCNVPQSGSGARGARRGAKVRRCEGMNERDYSEHLAQPL
jgi:hypothetical protein